MSNYFHPKADDIVCLPKLGYHKVSDLESELARLRRIAEAVACDIRANFSEGELATTETLIGGWLAQLDAAKNAQLDEATRGKEGGREITEERAALLVSVIINGDKHDGPLSITMEEIEWLSDRFGDVASIINHRMAIAMQNQVMRDMWTQALAAVGKEGKE